MTSHLRRKTELSAVQPAAGFATEGNEGTKKAKTSRAAKRVRALFCAIPKRNSPVQGGTATGTKPVRVRATPRAPLACDGS